MQWLTIGTIIVVIIGIVYFIIKQFYTPGNIKVYAKGPINLSTKSVVISGDDSKNLMQSAAGSTLSAYIKLDAIDKSNGIKTIMEQPGSWAFRMVGVSVNNLNPYYEFIVYSSQSGEIEKIALDNFPEQKWVYLSILREGRRFDIMYNNRIVGSKYLEHYPKIETQAITVGGGGIRGTAAYINGASKRYTYEEVTDEWKSRADTRGEPYLADEFTFPTFGCPKGLFCFTALPKSTSMKKYWSSPYA